MIEKLTYFAMVVPDMEKSVDFYTKILELEINEVETVPGFYTQFKVESVAGLALIQGLDQDGFDERFDIALRVNDVDKFYTHLLRKGVKEMSVPRDLPWGRTFLFKSPDGHVLRAYSNHKKTKE